MESSALQPAESLAPARALVGQLDALLTQQAEPASRNLLRLSRNLGPASFAWDVQVLHQALGLAQGALDGMVPAESAEPTHWLGLDGGLPTAPGDLPAQARDAVVQAVLEAQACVRGLAAHDVQHGGVARGALVELQQHWRALDAVVVQAGASLAQLWRLLRAPQDAGSSADELQQLDGRSRGFADAIKHLHAALQASLEAHRTGTAIVAARVTLLEMVGARLDDSAAACLHWRVAGDEPAARLALQSSLEAALAACASLRRSESELQRALLRLRDALRLAHQRH